MNISDYRRDFAAYCSALELAHYQHRAGFDKELHLEPIYERYGDLFTLDAIGALQHAYDETSAHLETERRGLRLLASAARAGYLEAQARELTDEVVLCQVAARVEWEGERVPVNNVPKLISNEPTASRRRELAARWVDAGRTCNDLRAARLESFHEAAGQLGFDSYLALFTDILDTDFRRLAVQAGRFLERTESAYASALSRAVARDVPGVAVDDLQHADYFFFQRMSRLDPYFPAQGLITTYADAMNSLGISVGQQTNIHIDAEERPFKNPRPACFRINPPDDVRLLIAPVGGAHDYTMLFHEAGHAQHFGWSSRELSKRHPEFLYAPDQATGEGHAFILSHLLHDTGWLMQHRSGVGPDQAREIVRELALLTCGNVRRRCASLSYEIELHGAGSSLRSERLAASYSDSLSQATGFRRSPALYLIDVDDGFYSAAYLRAWAFEVSLREYLRTRWGRRWWASRKAGDELIDLWNTSSRYTVEELAELIGFGEISFDLLADDLIAAMKED
ncbi:MAG TPA: hypothetical protein VM095_15045 [Pyrinomonadaceae bacterium]|nr:hypothetical protein [Pyrinomonadaceae bacterium]